MIRATVYFAGRVQGVGFRYTTCHVARGFDVTGYVMNLPDGRVECVAEGERAEVDRFIAGVEHAMGSHVTDAVRADAPATGEFAGFRVRH